jgi:hypothetical protein
LIEILVAQASQAAEKVAACHSEGGVCPRNLLLADLGEKADLSVAAATSG